MPRCSATSRFSCIFPRPAMPCVGLRVRPKRDRPQYTPVSKTSRAYRAWRSDSIVVHICSDSVRGCSLRSKLESSICNAGCGARRPPVGVQKIAHTRRCTCVSSAVALFAGVCFSFSFVSSCKVTLSRPSTVDGQRPTCAHCNMPEQRHGASRIPRHIREAI